MMRRRRSFRSGARARKPRMFWYTSLEGNLVAGGQSLSAGVTSSLPLAVVPQDGPAGGLLTTGAEAPHLDRLRVLAIRGDISVYNGGTGVALVRLGIMVDRIYPGATGSKLQEGATAYVPEVIGASSADVLGSGWSNYAAAPWMWLRSLILPPLSTLVTSYPTSDVHVKTRRVLTQGQGLFLFASYRSWSGVPSPVIVPALRTLLSKGA